jgi:hypothetical protein
MHARREDKHILLGLTFFESQVLRQILLFIGETYGKKPSELDPPAVAAWYSTRGCESAGMSSEETQDWVAQMHEFRSGRRVFIEKCVQNLRAKEIAKPLELTLGLEEASELVTILNDHRLLTAARNEIGQKEMDLNSMADFSALPAPQQTALTEIHFLAYLIESLLHLLSQDATASTGEGEAIV